MAAPGLRSMIVCDWLRLAALCHTVLAGGAGMKGKRKLQQTPPAPTLIERTSHNTRFIEFPEAQGRTVEKILRFWQFWRSAPHGFTNAVLKDPRLSL